MAVTMPGGVELRDVSIVADVGELRIDDATGTRLAERVDVTRVARLDRRTWIVYFVDGTQAQVWRQRKCCEFSV